MEVQSEQLVPVVTPSMLGQLGGHVLCQLMHGKLIPRELLMWVIWGWRPVVGLAEKLHRHTHR